MDRRNFLKQASGYTLATIGAITGIGKVFSESTAYKEFKTNELSFSDNLVHKKDYCCPIKVDNIKKLWLDR